MVIDHKDLQDRVIYVTCNASNVGTGAMLSFGNSWEMASPVAFKSAQLLSTEGNYPVHEKEPLSIVKALVWWKFDLLGTHFKIYMDHRMLESFMTQCDLSRWQARWQEFLAQYDFDIV